MSDISNTNEHHPCVFHELFTLVVESPSPQNLLVWFYVIGKKVLASAHE